jgi:hypothetical protein
MLEILERDENAVTSQSADIAEEAAERWTVRVNSEIPEEYVKELSVKPG